MKRRARVGRTGLILQSLLTLAIVRHTPWRLVIRYIVPVSAGAW
jgi:hypothetical protein